MFVRSEVAEEKSRNAQKCRRFSRRNVVSCMAVVVVVVAAVVVVVAAAVDVNADVAGDLFPIE